MIVRAHLWAAAPALLLVSLIGTQLVVLQNVLHDPSFAIEEDYYQKAVDWDVRQQEEREGRRLGWQLSLSTTCQPAGTEVDAKLLDPSGQPVSGALLSVEAFHNARAATVLRVALGEGDPGQYRGTLPAGKPGLWEYRVEIQRRGVRYTEVVRRDAPLPHSAPFRPSRPERGPAGTGQL